MCGRKGPDLVNARHVILVEIKEVLAYGSENLSAAQQPLAAVGGWREHEPPRLKLGPVWKAASERSPMGQVHDEADVVGNRSAA